MSDPPNPLLPPPSLEQEIRRLIATHGREAVKAIATQLTKRPRGRTPERDWKPLAEHLKRDAADWLTGRNRVTNYAIAKAVTEQHPGHSVPATMTRIQKKLGQFRERWMLAYAHWLTAIDANGRQSAGQERYPFTQYFRTMEALAKAEPDHPWGEWLEQDRLTLERYREIHGEPDTAMTWDEVKEKALIPVNALLALQPAKPSSGGMFGAPRRSAK